MIKSKKNPENQRQKPPIIIIIDMAIPSDYNIQKKAAEKMSKYVALWTEFHRIWTKR